MLSKQTRRILLVRCANHPVAHCARCNKEWFREELRGKTPASDDQGVLCRRCWADLTPNIQRHVFTCLLSWTHEEQVLEQILNHCRGYSSPPRPQPRR